MKEVRITLEDKEFEKLTRKKGERSWHDFILLLIKEAPKFEPPQGTGDIA